MTQKNQSLLVFSEVMTSNQSSTLNLAIQQKIQNDAERLTWALWLMLIFVISLLGDGTILVASIKYKAFKLHKVIVIFIQNIAACDLLITVISIFTQSVSLMADRWIFGTHVCYMKVYLGFMGTVASILLVCGMTVSKLLMVKRPLKARCWSRRRGHGVCAGLWALSCSVPLTFFIVDKDDLGVNRTTYTCSYNSTGEIWKWLKLVNVGLFVAIPTVIMVVTSILLVQHLRYARQVALKTGGTVRWQGIATVVLTATVYCLSSLPTSIHMVIWPYVKSYTYRVNGPRVTDTFMYFNVVANVFVYSITVGSFREFLKKRVEQTSSYLSDVIVNPGKEQNVSLHNFKTLQFNHLEVNISKHQ